MSTSWYVYIVRCADASLYTGVTTDLQRRVAEHNTARGGARYTRQRQPVALVYSEPADSRQQACIREYRIKQLSHPEKELLIKGSKR